MPLTSSSISGVRSTIFLSPENWQIVYAFFMIIFLSRNLSLSNILSIYVNKLGSEEFPFNWTPLGSRDHEAGRTSANDETPSAVLLDIAVKCGAKVSYYYMKSGRVSVAPNIPLKMF